VKPLVAIVGRPNVGKSTFFNRLIRERKAIVDDLPGVTRDRNYGDTIWFGRPFTLIDTGGFDPLETEGMLPLMREQAQLAIEEADIILFMLDARAGLLSADYEIYDILRRTEKPLFVVGNKVEGNAIRAEASELYTLGVEKLFLTSGEHGDGIHDLIEAVLEVFPEDDGSSDEPIDEHTTAVAVVGKPNVGKSSLINHLLGEPRLLASDVAGTTRDAIDTEMEFDGRKYLFIDTAGIRRKRSVSMRIERFSVVKALKSMERAQVALLMIDATEGVTFQDGKLAGLVEHRGCGVIVVVNKWDLIKKDSTTAGEFVKELWHQLPSLSYAPVNFTSALSGQRVVKVLDLVDKVRKNAEQRITTGVINRVMEEIVTRHAPALYRNHRIKFFYATQVTNLPPTFVVSTNHPEGITPDYRRYFVGKLRERFDFEGTPIRVFFRKRGSEDDPTGKAPGSKGGGGKGRGKGRGRKR